MYEEQKKYSISVRQKDGETKISEG